ncbi:MAG: hypothetical protein P1U34_11260 [Coxiellaceae bacterium]|nr:hypothetical protein [Coxiellaceae bacterium]
MPTLFSGMPDPDPLLSWDDYRTIVGILNIHFDSDDRPEVARDEAREQLDFLNNLISLSESDALNGRERAMIIRGVLLEGSSQDECYFTDQPAGIDNLHNAGHTVISDILKRFNLLKRNEIDPDNHVIFIELAENSQSEMEELHSTKPHLFEPTTPTSFRFTY